MVPQAYWTHWAALLLWLPWPTRNKKSGSFFNTSHFIRCSSEQSHGRSKTFSIRISTSGRQRLLSNPNSQAMERKVSAQKTDMYMPILSSRDAPVVLDNGKQWAHLSRLSLRSSLSLCRIISVSDLACVNSSRSAVRGAVWSLTSPDSQATLVDKSQPKFPWDKAKMAGYFHASHAAIS